MSPGWARAATLAVVAVATVSIAGCEVSLFGSDPVTVVGTSTGSGGPQGQACSEPDDAQRAREHEDACGERCRIEDGAIVGECDAVSIEDGVATIDLSDADGLVMRVEVCDPQGTVFELGDARPRTSSSHDARLVAEGTTMTVHGSEGSGVADSAIGHWVDETGCSTRTMSFSDQLVYFADAEAGLCGTGMLRISPPVDDDGRPDATWFLGLGRALEGDATGTGLRSADLCLW